MEVTLDEIRKNKPEGATHYIKYSGGVLYMRKSKSTWDRWVNKNEWSYCRPKFYLRLFKIKPLY